jgi:hypothetical protein
LWKPAHGYRFRKKRVAGFGSRWRSRIEPIIEIRKPSFSRKGSHIWAKIENSLCYALANLCRTKLSRTKIIPCSLSTEHLIIDDRLAARFIDMLQRFNPSAPVSILVWECSLNIHYHSHTSRSLVFW